MSSRIHSCIYCLVLSLAKKKKIYTYIYIYIFIQIAFFISLLLLWASILHLHANGGKRVSRPPKRYASGAIYVAAKNVTIPAKEKHTISIIFYSILFCCSWRWLPHPGRGELRAVSSLEPLLVLPSVAYSFAPHFGVKSYRQHHIFWCLWRWHSRTERGDLRALSSFEPLLIMLFPSRLGRGQAGAASWCSHACCMNNRIASLSFIIEDAFVGATDCCLWSIIFRSLRERHTLYCHYELN